ncbi:MAG: DUF5696 domain-containing protein [Eisenbergiella sp.]
MKEITAGGSTVRLHEETLLVSLFRNDAEWNWREDFVPTLECDEGIFSFTDARSVSHELFQNGIGTGIRSCFEGFEANGTVRPYSFETLIWIEAVSGDIRFEWLPLCEEGLSVKKVRWPGEMSFEKASRSWYSILNHQQGLLVPNDWETALDHVVFNGFFETAGAYMPWFGQVKDREGYIAICETPWNAGYTAEHPAGGPYSHVGIYYEPSLGKMDYRRVLRYTLLSDCDYNDLCKVYRAYVRETGHLRTLAEKAAQNPSVDRLIGCSFVHTGIKTVVQPDSDFFDPENPEKNNHCTPFSKRTEEIKLLHNMGVEKLYLHLDGWAQPGYDNCHPDYSPACIEAGGWEGMKELADTMHECGYLFGIHDQYRDFYKSAKSFDENYACRLTDGTIPEHHRWAGGPQSYLCATQAPYYLRRNFAALFENGIELDGAYLDVFTCNEGDECTNPEHRMTRRECYEYRGQCFSWLLAHGILSSSEEVSDWAIPSLVFCHYAPYSFMMKRPGLPKDGIPVPLFNLVYHDCVIEPWMMDKASENDDYMLYALLNGGAPYLLRDAAYLNTDGSFEGDELLALEEMIRRSKTVSALHEKIAKCEMVRHRMNPENWWIQETEFSDGTKVKVDFKNQTYEISEGSL